MYTSCMKQRKFVVYVDIWSIHLPLQHQNHRHHRCLHGTRARLYMQEQRHPHRIHLNLLDRWSNRVKLSRQHLLEIRKQNISKLSFKLSNEFNFNFEIDFYFLLTHLPETLASDKRDINKSKTFIVIAKYSELKLKRNDKICYWTQQLNKVSQKNWQYRIIVLDYSIMIK